MIILRHGKFISGTKIFRAGEILPPTPGVQALVEQNLAEVIADVRPPKTAKKAKSETAPENNEVNT